MRPRRPIRPSAASTPRRPRTAVSGALGTALLLCACGTDPQGGGETTGLEPLTIGLTFVEDIQFAPFYVALERGYYEEAGLEVALNHHGMEGGFTDLAAGNDDLVYAGGAELVEYRGESGLELVSVASLYQEHPVGLISLGGSGIEEAGDLRGRAVGVPGRFGETWFGLLAILAEAGLAEEDLDIQEIGFNQQADLVAGHIDAAMGYVNNDAVQLREQGEEVHTVEVPAEGLVSVGLVTDEATTAERREALAGAVEATLRGVEDVVQDPEEAVELSGAYVPDLDREEGRAAALAVLEATIPLYGDLGALGTQDPEAWRATVELLRQHGILSADLDPADAWTDEFLPGG